SKGARAQGSAGARAGTREVGDGAKGARAREVRGSLAPLAPSPTSWVPALAPALSRQGAWLLGLYTLFVLASFLRFNMEYFQAQGRYLFPALGPIAIAFAGGWLGWFRGRSARFGALALAMLMGTLALYVLLGVIRPNF